MIRKLLEADMRMQAMRSTANEFLPRHLQEMNPGTSMGKSGSYDIMRMEGPGYVGYHLVSRVGFGQGRIFLQVMGTGPTKTVGMSLPQGLLKKLPQTTRSGFVPVPAFGTGASGGQFFMGIYGAQNPIMTLDALDKDLQAMGATELRQIETMSSEKAPVKTGYEGEAPSPYANEPEVPGRGAWQGAYKSSGTGQIGAMGAKPGPGGFGRY